MTGKLHEVLAVEADLSKVSSNLVSESKRSFGKDHLFTGDVKLHKLFNEEQQHQAQPPQERKVESTVRENLNYLFNEGLIPYWDAVAQKDDANQRAQADIVVNGEVLCKNVAGTTLLGLESKLSSLLDLFKSIPTLAPGVNWTTAANERDGIFIAPKDTRLQSVKEPDFKVLYKATDKHPAQIKEFERVVNVGAFEVTAYSGMISSVEKAEYIKRLQTLIGAVKQARQRANTVEVNDVHIGKALTDFLLS